MGMRRVSVIGNVNVDLIVSPASVLPPPGEEWRVGSIEMRPGGAATNTALTLAGLGSPPAVAGCVGDDALGRYVLDELGRAGVGEGITVVSGTPTGVSVAFEAPGRDRSFLTALGSLEAFDPSMVPPEVLAADLLILCGYFLLPSLRGEPAVRLLDRARAKGATTLFDCGWDPDGWPPQSRAEIARLLPLVDVFLPNEVEAHGLTGEVEPLSAARILQDVSGGWIVVKLAPDGCRAVGPGGRELGTPAPAVEVTDTTGAGDAFNAGLLHALCRGLDWTEVLGFATRVAATVVSRPSGDRYSALADLVGGDRGGPSPSSGTVPR